MRNVVIADTSCFVILSKIDALFILPALYGTVTTTPEIAGEFGDTLPAWVSVTEVKDPMRTRILEMQVDRGEASALALALEIPDSVVVMDDLRGRKAAAALALRFTRTIGVIVRAKLAGIIPAVKPVLEAIRRTDFRISDALEHQALIQAGET